MKNMSSFIKLVILVSACFAVLIFILSRPEKKVEESDENMVSIADIGDGFLYYDGDVYYKNKSICIKDSSEVGEKVGENTYHLMYDDIVDNSFKYKDGIYIYAEEVGTEVFKFKGRDDILLVPTEYNLNGYYLYEKEIHNYDFEYFLENDYDSKTLIGYFLNEIPISFELSDFKKSDNEYSNSSSNNGFMGYYLLIYKNDVCYKFECSGNVFSNIILLDTDNAQYVLEKEGLSDILINMYSDFFEIDSEDLISKESEVIEEESTQAPIEDIREGEEVIEKETLKPLQ